MRLTKAYEKKAYVPFTVIGDPDYETSYKIVKAFIKSGASMLELGISYTDPIADGPRIQAADTRVLSHGFDINDIFAFISKVRENTELPICLLIYYNLMFKPGLKNFISKAKKCGVDGILAADLCIEESDEFVKSCKNHKVAPVFMVTPNTTDERIKRILGVAGGYVYLVGVYGVTGERAEVSYEALDLIKRVKAASHLPVCVGFGISTPDQAKAVISAGADGVIVGSANVKIIEENLSDKKKMISKIEEFTKEMVEMIR